MTGTIIHATHRPEDLIPAFINALSERLEEERFRWEPGVDKQAEIMAVGFLQGILGNIERRANKPEYFNSEDAMWDLEWLFDHLDQHAPEGHSFGAHEDDGADFGFWPIEEDES